MLEGRTDGLVDTPRGVVDVAFSQLARIAPPNIEDATVEVSTTTHSFLLEGVDDVITMMAASEAPMVAGKALPYSRYDKLSEVDQGAIMESKRLGHMPQIAKEVQAKRDSRAVNVPSTAHRADGKPVPRKKLAGTKRQRELTPADMLEAVNRTTLAASAALRASDSLTGGQQVRT